MANLGIHTIDDVEPVTSILVETGQKAAKSQSNGKINPASSSVESDTNKNQNDDADWGRDSDQASYVTFFRPTKSLIRTLDGDKKKRGRNIEPAPADSDLEIPPIVNEEDEEQESSTNCEDNDSESTDAQDKNAESDVVEDSTSETSSSSQQEQSSSRLSNTRKRRNVRKIQSKASKAKRSRLEVKKKKKTVSKSSQRVTRRTSRKAKVLEKDTDEEGHSSDNSTESSSEEEMLNYTPSKRSRTRRSQRQITPKKLNKREQMKQDAFENLRKMREKQANKPKAKSPVRETKSSEGEEDSDSDSNYSPGSSPVPIVSNSSADGTDFEDDGSTLSSSSVTSSGETDEEPDLEIGGSDGEVNLPNSEEIAEENVDAEVASCSSSSDDEPPSDGQNDQRCILCKNLQSAKIEGRATLNIDPRDSCKCGKCVKFSPNVGDYDLVCCREIKTVKEFLKDELEGKNVCITDHPRFEADVLNNEGFARAITKHREPSKFWQRSYWQDHDDRHTSRRVNTASAEKATGDFKRASKEEKTWKSFSSYKYWIFDKLNDRDSRQIVIPACVKAKVFSTLGTLSEFRRFRAQQICPHQQHCRPAFASYY